jgi:hypothetical protein
MALQYINWTAVREIQPPIFAVEGLILSPDSPAQGGGYGVTTGARLVKIPSPDPTILVLDLALHLEQHPTYDPHHEQRVLPVRYDEHLASEASEAYEKVHIRYQGLTITEITVRVRPSARPGS